MPRILRRTPTSEKAAIYGYKDLLRDSIRYVGQKASANVERMTSGGLSNEELMEMALAGIGAGTKIPKGVKGILGKYKSQGLTYDAYVNQIPDRPEFAYHQWTFRGGSPLQGDTITTKGTSIDEMEKKVASKIRDYYGGMLDFWEKK